MFLEDEMGLLIDVLLLNDDFEMPESPPVCTPWDCIGHATAEETIAVHEAIESCYAAARASNHRRPIG